MTGLNVLRLLPKCALLLTLAAAINLALAADQPAASTEWQKAVQLQQQNGNNDPTNLKAALSSATQQPATSTSTSVPAKSSLHVSAVATTSTRTQPTKISGTSSKPAPQAHIWNLKDADLLQVIAEVARETGKNFIVDPQVSGKVTIISTRPLAPAAVYQMFLSTLQVLNFAAVPAGNATKIIALHDASREAGKVFSGAVPEGGAMVVDVIPLHYISAIQLVPILNPLIPTWATVSAVVTANSIIVSGSQSVVNRVYQIIERVDTPSSNGVDVIPMQYSIADDVAKELTDLIQSARSYGEMVNAAISSDERSNSILLSGNASARLRLKILISQLDQPGSNGMGDTQVIHLHYIQVQDILPILRGMADQNPGSAGASASSPTSMSSSSSDSSSSSSASGTGGLTSGYSNFTNQVQTITNAELNSGAVGSTGTNGKPQQTIITGDVTNNALIITAPNGMMLKLKSVISRLDTRPQQVLVQGVIAEVDASKAQNFGIQWGSNAVDGGQSPLGPTNAFAATGGMGVGLIQDGDFRAVVQALATDTSSNVLSTPSITVLNNGHADIEVGQTISETTGQYQTPSNGGTGNGEPYIQYQDKNVGLTLTVTPQISGDDTIRMAIDQTNSAVIPDSTTDINPNPETTQEKISTSVLINNGQILVLGGLMDSHLEKVVQKVPLLGDIPLIGLIFRHNTDTNVKKVLLIFLRPIVINTPDQANSLSLDRYNFLRDRQILTENGQSDFTAGSTLMSPNGIDLPVPFSKP